MTPADSALIDDFLAGRRPNTRTAYATALNAWVRWCETGGTDPIRPTVGECRTYHAERRAGGEAAATTSQRCRVLSAFHGQVARLGTIPSNPWQDVKIVAAPTQSTTDYLDATDHARLLTHTATHGTPITNAMVRLLAVVGMRHDEVRLFRYENLRLVAGEWVYRYQGKGDKDTVKVIDDQTVDAIRYAIADRKDTTGFLFVGRGGKPIDPGTVRNTVRNACLAAGVPQVPPHGLRHSAITRIFEGTGDAHMAQEFGNHAQVATTHRYDRRSGLQAAGVEHVVRATTEGTDHAR